MPPEILKLDKTLAQASQDLAVLWIADDRKKHIPPSSNQIKSWWSLEKSCFLLDELSYIESSRGGASEGIDAQGYKQPLQCSFNSKLLKMSFAIVC
jgi:hypothetical protein